MHVAQETRKRNIIEYILYIWQLENILRAAKFDLSIIEDKLIAPQGLNSNEKELEKEWYKEFIASMKDQGIVEKGHTSETIEILSELTLLHETLLKSIKDQKYQLLYTRAKPELEVLRSKQDGLTKTEVDIAVNGAYAFWMLKVSGKKISAATSSAMENITSLLAYLSAQYHKMMNQVDGLKQ
jgi:hypothetical protein